METGQRGFLLTGKEESLEPYVAGQQALVLDLNRLRNVSSQFNISQAEIREVEKQVGIGLSRQLHQR